MESNKWNDYTNDTLVHLHKKTRSQKKMYQRASDLHHSFYSFFGLITVLTSTVASTISWGSNKDMNEKEKFILSLITTTSAISAAIQNFYSFQENSSKLTLTSKNYAQLQNKIENIGNIHPENRQDDPYDFFKQIDTELDKITENRYELSSCLTKCCYLKKGDDFSYLREKHDKYNNNNKDIELIIRTGSESEN
jgi:hypothetical protein